VRRDSRTTIWATRAGWRGAVGLGAGRFGPRRPSSVRLRAWPSARVARLPPGEWRRARRCSGLAGKGKELLVPRLHPQADGTSSWANDGTAVRGAPPLRKKVVSSQRTTKAKAKAKARRSHSLPLLAYSRLGGLRQDPGRAAESAAGPRTDEDMGVRRACVVVDLWGTR
jgi:hypothetical protein